MSNKRNPGNCTGTIINTNKTNYFKLQTMPWTCPNCNTTRKVKLYQKVLNCAYCGNQEKADEETRQKAIENFRKNGPNHKYKSRFQKLR